MSEMPERIWAWLYTGDFNRVEWLGRETVTTDVEYIRADLAALSSAAVAEREPVTHDHIEVTDAGLLQFADWFRKNYPGPDTVIHKPDWHAPKIYRAACHAFKNSTPSTSELEAEIARLRAERDDLKEEWQAEFESRVEANTALRMTKSRLAEAMKALEMFPELFLSFVGPVNDEWFIRFADAVKIARRVREGGKVE